MSDCVIVRHQEGVLELLINRPDKRNALNNEVLSAIDEALTFAEGNSEVRSIIVSGVGDHFSAGADVDMLASPGNTDDMDRSIMYGTYVIERLARFTKPVVAAVKGYALGGGFELALSCDLIVAAENAKFGLPEIKLGLIPGAGGVQSLVRQVGVAAAKRIALTGEAVSADEAYRMGLVYKITPADHVMDVARQVALTLAGYLSTSMKSLKLCLNNAVDMSTAAGWEFARQHFRQLVRLPEVQEKLNALKSSTQQQGKSSA